MQEIVKEFREGGGEGKPLYLQTHISYANSADEARANAFDQWRSNAICAAVAETLRLPEEFEQASEGPAGRYGRARAHFGRSRGSCEAVKADIAMGFDEIYVHNVGRNHREFIEVFGNMVLSSIRDTNRTQNQA